MKLKVLNIEVDYYFKNLEHSKTFVYIHGFNSTFEQFRDLYEEMILKENFNFLAFNLPGHGETNSKIEDINFRFYVKFSKELLILLLPQTNHQIFLHGHSMGGGIALALNTFDFEIVKTIVVSPMNRSSLAKKISLNRYYLPASLKEAKKLLTLAYNQGESYWKNSQNIASIGRDVASLFSNKTRIKQMSWLLEDLVKKPNMDLIDEGIKATVNLTLFFGAEDELIDVLEIQEYFWSLNPNTKVYVRPKMGHTPWQEDEKFYRNWLQKNL